MMKVYLITSGTGDDGNEWQLHGTYLWKEEAEKDRDRWEKEKNLPGFYSVEEEVVMASAEAEAAVKADLVKFYTLCHVMNNLVPSQFMATARGIAARLRAVFPGEIKYTVNLGEERIAK